MATRSPFDETLHDKVINEAVRRLDSVNYDIYTNPGKVKRYGIGDNYPDIILTRKGENTVQFIIEVETVESINISEATNQWKKYSNEIKASFYILVPVSYKNAAIHLCKQIGISARFGTYQTDGSRNITTIAYE